MLSVLTQSLFYCSDIRLHLTELCPKSQQDVFSQAFELFLDLRNCIGISLHGFHVVPHFQQDGNEFVQLGVGRIHSRHQWQIDSLDLMFSA